jgi:hypothetical protein
MNWTTIKRCAAILAGGTTLLLADGDWGYRDQGHIGADEDGVWFDSEVSGVSYQGLVGGGEVTIVYDWCFNGVPDVQLVFE